MSKEEKRNTIIKWILYGVLASASIVISIFHNQIFSETSYFSKFTNSNAIVTYLVHDAVPNLCKSVLIIGIAVTLAILISLLSKISFKSKKANTLAKLFVSFLKWVIALVAIFMVISAWGASTTITLAGAGILTLIIGLGSQSLVADILAGVFIVFEGDFQVGDIVVVDGWRGEVQQIGIRTTRLIDAGGNIKIVNNSDIRSIINQTKELSIAKCIVGISYNERIERVESVFSDNLNWIKEKVPGIVDGPFYKGVSELGESAVTLLFVAKCKEDDIYQVQRDLNRAIKILFDENNISIPFNQLDVHMIDDGENNLDISKKEIKKAENFNEKQRELSKDIDDRDNN